MAYIIKPLVTEKMTAITEKQNNKFGFIVRPDANKIEIKKEIEAKYKETNDNRLLPILKNVKNAISEW